LVIFTIHRRDDKRKALHALSVERNAAPPAAVIESIFRPTTGVMMLL
jgi:hypothetical protein